jgi:hypothetical protein
VINVAIAGFVLMLTILCFPVEEGIFEPHMCEEGYGSVNVVSDFTPAVTAYQISRKSKIIS